MRRTNIYLGDEQCSALDEIARSNGTSRAEVIRRLIDRAIAFDQDDLRDDLSAINESFGALAGEEVAFDRAPDRRWRHLDDMAEA